MSTPSPLDEGLTPERLTEAMRGAGALDGARVAEVVVESARTTLISTIERLRLRYAGGDGPATLIRKQPRGDIDATLRAILGKEIVFYAKVAPNTPPGGLPRCYGIGGADGGARSLLLEDLTDSHTIISEWPLPPTLEQCERIMDTYAAFHARWWDDPRLGTSIGAWGDTSGEFERHRVEFEKRLPAFADRLATAWLPSAWRSTSGCWRRGRGCWFVTGRIGGSRSSTATPTSGTRCIRAIRRRTGSG